MPTRGVNLTSNRVKQLFAGVILCLSMSLSVACQQTNQSLSNNNSEDLTEQPANNNNNEDIATAPPKTPGEVTLNQPSPSPTLQATPSTSPKPVAAVPQNQTQTPATQSSPKANSISKALTEKLSPDKPASQADIPAQNTSDKPVVEALRNEAKNPARKIAAASNTNVYRSRRLGVNFKYPKGFVIKEPQENSGSSSKVVELWNLKDYQAIAKGKFQNTFSPGNMRISLENNPQGLSLVQWVTNNDELGDIIPESYDAHIVAGKEAMSFRTDGLYEFQNMVLPTEDGKNIILISFVEGDKSYQKVFEQVVSSLQVN